LPVSQVGIIPCHSYCGLIGKFLGGVKEVSRYIFYSRHNYARFIYSKLSMWQYSEIGRTKKGNLPALYRLKTSKKKSPDKASGDLH
jgi:hypothetical protein